MTPIKGFVDNSDGNYEAYYKEYGEFRLYAVRHKNYDKEGIFDVCIIESDKPYYEIPITGNKPVAWIERFSNLLSENNEG